MYANSSTWIISFLFNDRLLKVFNELDNSIEDAKPRMRHAQRPRDYYDEGMLLKFILVRLDISLKLNIIFVTTDPFPQWATMNGAVRVYCNNNVLPEYHCCYGDHSNTRECEKYFTNRNYTHIMYVEMLIFNSRWLRCACWQQFHTKFVNDRWRKAICSATR